MDAPTWTNIGSGIVAAGFLVWGILEKFKKENALRATKVAEDKNEVIKGKDELVQVQRERAETWKSKYDSEHAEFLQYRQETHDRLGKAQTLVLQHTEEVAQLRAKTDLTPVKVWQDNQTALMAKLMETLSNINISQVKISTTQDLLIESILQNQEGRKIKNEQRDNQKSSS